jgi:Fungal specific transcription factor domain
MTSDTFTLEDMRFFHHFLIKAKPHMPVGNAAVWAREIPQLTQQNEFLMHSFLALGSSHLGRLVDNQSFQVQSLTYRVKGLAGLREAMAKELWAYGDADSMIAAGYSLMQQSAHIEDGMGDWMSLLRMAISISFRVAESGARTEFDLSPGKHQEYMAPYQHLMPSVDQHLLPRALTALENLRTDLTDPFAISFHAVLEHCLREHQASPLQGYIAYGGCFKLWLDQSEESFAECIDPRNGEVQLLMAYFILILLMMMAQGIVENHEAVQWSNPRHILGMLGWIRNALLNVPLRLREHTMFVEDALAAAVAEINGEVVPGPRVLQFNVAQEFLGKINAIRLEEQTRKQSVSCESASERSSGLRRQSYEV